MIPASSISLHFLLVISTSRGDCRRGLQNTDLLLMVWNSSGPLMPWYPLTSCKL